MDLHLAQQRFAIAYYRWAAEWLHSDLASGFSHLRSCGCDSATRYVAFIESLPIQIRADYVRCLQDHFHLFALRKLGRTELELCEEPLMKYRQFLLQANGVALNERPDAEGRARLRNAIKEEISSLDELEFQDLGGGGWIYFLRCGDVVVTTSIYTGGRSLSLTYSQSISFSASEVIASHLSILSWCGIAGQTQWTNIRGQEEAIAASLRRVMELFFNAVPSLVADIKL